MNQNLFVAIIISSSLCFALGKTASEVRIEPNSGKVEFEAVGRPDMLIINGKGEGVTSNLKLNDSKLSGEVSFNLESLKTGIELRDHDMKEKYLQIKNYPVAKLVFEEFQMPAGWSLKNSKVVLSSFRGKLTLHGVEREITGLYTINPDFLKTTARFEIKLSDFKIQIPVYLGIKVADFVKVSITIDKMTIIK